MAVRNADLVDFFGADNVVLVNPELIIGLKLPEESVEVLTGVGLPTEVEPLPFHPVDPRMLAETPLGRVYIFGRGYDSVYCLTDNAGEVWELNDLPEKSPIFINSGLISFVECLLRFAILWNQVPETITSGGAVGERWGGFLEDELRRVDPRAVEKPDNYFSFIVRDIRNGTF